MFGNSQTQFTASGCCCQDDLLLVCDFLISVIFLASMSAWAYSADMAFDSDYEVQLTQFEPWRKYSSLTEERLTVVANIIRDARHDCVLLHEADKGDTNWDLGCRVYSRTCFSLRTHSVIYPEWLKILPESRGLQFSFAIDTVPFRFYRGTPEDPPDRYRICTFGELHHQQMCLQLEGFRPPDGVLRIAVETSPATLEVTSVGVVEVDDAGNPINVYYVTLSQTHTSNITVMHAEPIELAPPLVEPLHPSWN